MRLVVNRDAWLDDITSIITIFPTDAKKSGHVTLSYFVTHVMKPYVSISNDVKTWLLIIFWETRRIFSWDSKMLSPLIKLPDYFLYSSVVTHLLFDGVVNDGFRSMGSQAGQWWTEMGLASLLPREQTMVSRNNAADEKLSKENMGLTSWVLKARSWANTLATISSQWISTAEGGSDLEVEGEREHVGAWMLPATSCTCVVLYVDCMLRLGNYCRSIDIFRSYIKS